MATRLGRIHSIRLGYGGYQDAMFGINIEFKGPGWGVGTFAGFWSIDTPVAEHTRWTEKDRDKTFALTMRKANEWVRDAGKRTLDEMAGVPVEVTFKDGALESWRVLKEVL